jgi:peptidoglycan hydrolase-like protein with peptidoglycan-binding domain
MNMRKRYNILLLIAISAVTFAAGGLTAPLWVKSPQRLAAEAQPPAPTVLTAAVERRVLRDVLFVRGGIRPGQPHEVTPQGVPAGPGIVTAIKVRRGDRIAAGTALVEISGRPLMVLPGAVPAFRDLKPGMVGKDVRQLQDALRILGHRPADPEGVFGGSTKQALSAYYRYLGYEPPTVGSETDIADMQREVTAAERQVVDARETLQAVSGDPAAGDTDRRAAAKALTRAEEDLVVVRARFDELVRTTGAMLPLGEYAFVPSFPAVLVESKAVLGAPVAAPLFTLSTGSPVVTANLTEAQRALCKLGATVAITGDGGLNLNGTVSAVGEPATLTDSASGRAGAAGVGGAPDATAEGAMVTVAVTPALEPQRVGQDVLLSIEVTATGQEELVVPVSAIYAGGDGSVYVMKMSGDGGERKVRVQPGLSAQGYVVVTADPGELAQGDLVMIGGAP